MAHATSPTPTLSPARHPRRLTLYTWLPTWHTDLAARRRRRHGDTPEIYPIILTRLVADRRMVAEACAICRKAGVIPGLTLTQARQRLGACPNLYLETWRDETRALEALAQWARRFTPLTATDSPDGLRLEITGCGHLFGGDSALAQQVQNQLRHLQIGCRVAVAPTMAAARGLARWAPDASPILLMDPAALPCTVSALPIEALHLSSVIIERLREVGLETIGQILKLPREDLITRYGSSLVETLDAMLDRNTSSPWSVTPPDSVRTFKQHFNGPVRDLETIRLALTELIKKLCASLAEADRGVDLLDIRIERPRQNALIHTLRLTAPTRTSQHLLAILAPTIERLDPGPDGTECLEVRVIREQPLYLRQPVNWDERTPSAPEPETLHQLVDILRQRCGFENITRRLRADAHLPEHAVQEQAWDHDSMGPPILQPPHQDRPTVMFTPAEPARVTLPTALRPGALEWRGHTAPLIDARGPERLVEAWWMHSDPTTRDYWRVQRHDGQWLWVYQDRQQGTWFVQGGWT